MAPSAPRASFTHTRYYSRRLSGYWFPPACAASTQLVALDLDGTGAQDRDAEAILEIAVVPITDGRPSLDHSYATLVNPGRPVPRRPGSPPA